MVRDRPKQIQIIDVAVNGLPALLRDALLLKYLVDRDKHGVSVTYRDRAKALGVRREEYESLVLAAKVLAEIDIHKRVSRVSTSATEMLPAGV